MDQVQKARALGALHRQAGVLILANVWDAASARIVEEAGYPAVATSSAGVAFALGYPDGQKAPWNEHLGAIGRITRAVNVPVTADIEAGYGESLEDLSAAISDLIDAGAVGLNLEDAIGEKLIDPERQVERIHVVREAALAKGVPLFLNARSDFYWRGPGSEQERLQGTIERLRAYVKAGGDGVFVPGLSHPDAISAIVQAVAAPLNVLAGAGTPSIDELERLGVKRVSVGSAPMRAIMGLTQRIAKDLRERRSYQSMLDGAIPYPEANRLFA
jgi:2-methylisocitrate lyase-like PEP mutase family enzyme